VSRSHLLSPLAVVALTLFLALGAGPAATPTASAAPAVQVTTVVTGLSNPWDLTWVEPELLL
jgi:hypothetical protein